MPEALPMRPTPLLSAAVALVAITASPTLAVAGRYDAANGQVYQKLVQAPAFNLTTSGGGTLSLAKYAGKVRIIDFWATWCPPCKAEIPGFVALQKRYGKKGLVVLGISLDDDADALKNFMASYGVNYPVAVADAATKAAYGGIRAIPTTFVVGRKGYIYKKYVGGVDVSAFEQDIQALL